MISHIDNLKPYRNAGQQGFKGGSKSDIDPRLYYFIAKGEYLSG
jgi:hypothetical protein